MSVLVGLVMQWSFLVALDATKIKCYVCPRSNYLCSTNVMKSCGATQLVLHLRFNSFFGKIFCKINTSESDTVCDDWDCFSGGEHEEEWCYKYLYSKEKRVDLEFLWTKKMWVEHNTRNICFTSKCRGVTEVWGNCDSQFVRIEGCIALLCMRVW